MGPFGFLGDMSNGINQYFAPALSQVNSTLSQFFPSKSQNFSMVSTPKAPDIHPYIPTQPQPQAQPQQAQPQPTATDFQQGFSQFAPNTPVSTQAAQFVQAAQRLPSTMDPYLPAVIAMMETGGGAHTVAPNNAWNIRGIQNGQSQFISYPDYATALLGGNNQGVNSQGFVGTLLNNPAYAPYRASGNLQDFFNTYTPPGPAYGNPSMTELLQRYSALRALFPGVR